jgi:hypothetical protein
MEIRFSKNLDRPLWTVIEQAARHWNIMPRFTSANGLHFRFTLEADQDGHDKVIRALLTADPQANVRTSRAVFEGLADFEAQYKARNGGSK